MLIASSSLLRMVLVVLCDSELCCSSFARALSSCWSKISRMPRQSSSTLRFVLAEMFNIFSNLTLSSGIQMGSNCFIVTFKPTKLNYFFSSLIDHLLITFIVFVKLFKFRKFFTRIFSVHFIYDQNRRFFNQILVVQLEFLRKSQIIKYLYPKWKLV